MIQSSQGRAAEKPVRPSACTLLSGVIGIYTNSVCVHRITHTRAQAQEECYMTNKTLSTMGFDVIVS